MVKLQPIQLTSTLNGQLAHHGDSVIFTCTTKGSQLLAWSSIEYINGDLNRKRIVFSSDQMTGTLSIPNDYTSAQLTNVHDDVNGRPVIESQLNITIQKTTQNSSISCHHVGSGLNETISFKLSGKGLHLKSACVEKSLPCWSLCTIPTTPIVLKDRHLGGSAFHSVTEIRFA